MKSTANVLCRPRLTLTAIALATTLLLSGCTFLDDLFVASAPEDMNLNLAPQTLIEQGMEEYNKGRYYVAIEYFNTILENHRFTPEALLAELKVADCTYYMGKYDEAYAYYERFEEMHPTNEAIPYVMYQKAMCHYKRIDSIDRDTSGAQKAIERFQLLLNAYPDSPYAADAKAKIIAAKEFLANHEFVVAQFYLRIDEPSQAKIRLKYLIAMYPQTEIAPKAKTLLEDLQQQTN